MRSNLFSVESEHAFLGAIVHSAGTVLDQCQATPEHFTDPLASTVFRTISDLHASRTPISAMLVEHQFRNSDSEFRIRISTLLQYTPPSAGSHLFGILRDKVSLRRAHGMLEWASAELPNVGATDVDSFCSDLQHRAATLAAEGDAENVLGSCLDAIEAKCERMRKGLGNDGLTTPIKPWNDAFGGLLNGQLYGLAGRPGAGKTAMMEQMIESIVSEQIPVTVFEKDMAPQKLVERLACRTAQVPYWKLSRNGMRGDEITKLSTELKLWRKLPLRIYNPNSLTAERMCAIARRDIRVHGTRAVFLDHIQALRCGRDLREGLTQASLCIRATVTETNVPFVVLAHINRDGSEGRPRPEHIKEFDQLYGDADGLAMLWNEKGKSGEDLAPIRTVKFYVAKNREGGAAEDDLLFDGPELTFKTLAKTEREPTEHPNARKR